MPSRVDQAVSDRLAVIITDSARPPGFHRDPNDCGLEVLAAFVTTNGLCRHCAREVIIDENGREGGPVTRILSPGGRVVSRPEALF